MAEVLPERDYALVQNCIVAGALAGKLRIERYHAAEEDYEQEESHAGDENHAAGVYVGAGSHCVLAEGAETVGTAAEGNVALTGLVEIANTVALAGLVELADIAVPAGLAAVADDAVLGIVGSADTVAQGSLVVVAETAA